MESFDSSLLSAPFADNTLAAAPFADTSLAAATFAAPLETATFAAPLSTPSCGCKFIFLKHFSSQNILFY